MDASTVQTSPTPTPATSAAASPAAGTDLPAPIAAALPTTRDGRDEETARLAGAWAEATGLDRERLIQRLVEVNLPVATALARHYAGRGVPLPDLEQIASLGLVAAARRFDHARGGDFLAFAVPTIKGELRKAFRDQGWMIRPPRRLQELQARVWAAETVLCQRLERSPRASELAEYVDAEIDDVIEVLGMDGCYAPSSLDRPAGDDGEGTLLAERRGDLDPAFAEAEARLLLGPLLGRLEERDRRILELRFVEGWTQQQIGDEIGVTQMQVSRLLTRILRELRVALFPAPAA